MALYNGFGDEYFPAMSLTGSSSLESIDSDSSYTKIKVLGRGAFGEAVLYRKTATNELVVWKEINLRRATEREKIGALNEIEILSQLDHINVIAYYNDFFDGSALYIEMEYANDGSLHHKIVGQGNSLFDEGVVVNYFYQVISAVSYIHSYGILHRDIKTLNVFVTKGRILKLGDFGVSKVLEETYGNADTCVGTPYYMSPELVKGLSYDQKSDIWACGCLLYELMTLKKVFQASNQLKLICNILEDEPVEPNQKYSDELRQMVKRLLVKDPTCRPTAEELSDSNVFITAKSFVRTQSTVDGNLRRMASQRTMSSLSTPTTRGMTPVVSTLSSDVFYWGGGTILPKKIQMFAESAVSAVQVSTGFSHFAVISIEKELYTWANVQGGTEMVGQLGHGNKSMYRVPKKVAFFTGIPVRQVGCGEDFTVVLTETGEVYTFGSDYYGCIGCLQSKGEFVLAPTKVGVFSGIDIESVSCGDSHIVALTTDKCVYSWGCGEYGRLGLGNENEYAAPQLVKLPTGYSAISSITCGRDNTLLLTSKGDLIAFGNNENNKMGLNQTFRLKDGRLSEENVVHFSLDPIPVRALRSYKLIFLAAGKSHTAAIDEFNRLLTFGSNEYGQLGTGDFTRKEGPCLVRGDLYGKEIIACSCGDGFTVAVTKDNLIYSWGFGEDGRLGLHGNGDNNVAFPRPIFGSLQKVASISTRHWNTIMLTEQVLSSKVIKTKLLSPSDTDSGVFVEENKSPNQIDSSSSGSFKFVNDLKEYENCLDSFDTRSSDEQLTSFEDTQNETSSTSRDENEVPCWLADELKDAEFIPYDSNNTSMETHRPSSGTSRPSLEPSFRESRPVSRETKPKVYESTCSKCLEKDPSYLEVRLKELELENLSLHKKVKEQEVMIETLEKERDCYIRCSEKLMQLSEGNINSATAFF